MFRGKGSLCTPQIPDDPGTRLPLLCGKRGLRRIPEAQQRGRVESKDHSRSQALYSSSCRRVNHLGSWPASSCPARRGHQASPCVGWETMCNLWPRLSHSRRECLGHRFHLSCPPLRHVTSELQLLSVISFVLVKQLLFSALLPLTSSCASLPWGPICPSQFVFLTLSEATL